MPKSTLVWIILGAGALGLGGYAIGLPYAFTDPQRHIDVLAWAQAGEADGRELLAGARDTTVRDCGTTPGCAQAVTTTHVTMSKFDTREAAQAARADLGPDSYLSNWILIDYTDSATSEHQKLLLQEELDGHHASD